MITLSLMLLVLSAEGSSSAPDAIRGMVVDAADRSGIVGANVRILESNSGVVSKDDGSFVMVLSPMPQTLEVSRVGYVTERIKVPTKPDTTVIIPLKRIVYDLEDISVKPIEFGRVVAYAQPIVGPIVVDGNLDDWPSRLATYPISFLIEGTSGSRSGDQASKAYKIQENTGIGPVNDLDFKAEFSVAYNMESQLVYLAVKVVDDDRLVFGKMRRGPIGRHDGLAVWVDSRNDGNSGYLRPRRVQRYVVVPGDGLYSGTRTNPGLTGGKIEESVSQGAYKHHGGYVVYEWAIAPYDIFPKLRTTLYSGKTIGFEIAVKDADGDGSFSWVGWNPTATFKGWEKSGNFGLIKLVSDFGWIEGSVRIRESKLPISNRTLFLVGKDGCIGVFETDSNGYYRTILPEGVYDARLVGLHAESLEYRQIEIERTKLKTSDWELAQLVLPK